MSRKQSEVIYLEHKIFKTLKPNTEKVLRRLTLEPYSGMNEELNYRDKDVVMVLCRRGKNRKIIGWTLRDSRENCQIFVETKYRKTKTKNASYAEMIALELCSTYQVNGHYAHDQISYKFWEAMKNKHKIFKKLKSVVF